MGEFDKELDDYLSARRRTNIKGFIKDIFKPTEKKVEIPEDVEVYQSGEAKEPLIKRMFSKKENDEAIAAKVEAEDAVADMKEIAKIALVAIKELPDDRLASFKKGAEFDRLKELLKKHDLIR